MDLFDEGNWQAAIPELEGAIEIDPEMPLAWASLSCAYAFSGDHTKARAAYMKAEEFLDQANEMERRWIELDGIWLNTGNGDLYLETMQEYIRDFPDNRKSYFYAGLAHVFLKKDYAGAIAWLEKSFQLTPSYYPVTNSLADCYLKLGRQEDAIRVLERYGALSFISNHGREQVTSRLEGMQQGL
jgi:tetratricopeptide (TPR) repeat protein